MSYPLPGGPGQRQQPEKKGRIAAVIGTVAAIVTILTFIFTHPWQQDPPGPGPSPSPSVTTTWSLGAYPQAAEEGWMSDCTGRNNSQSTCACELSYFEHHASYPQFQSDYSAMPPGVVPPELSGAVSCSNLEPYRMGRTSRTMRLRSASLACPFERS